MGIEIERKFLVRGDQWKIGVTSEVYRQGYLSFEQAATVRVRVTPQKAFLTIKGPSKGIARSEFEYEIPRSDAEAMLALCTGALIEKRRYKIEYSGHLWEVDEFLGDNAGLIVAEIELSSETEPFVMPDWIEREVSGDPRYFNSNLVQNPFCNWDG